MTTVHLITNRLSMEPEETVCVESVTAYLKARYPGGFPEDSAIYACGPDRLAQPFDVTPDGSPESLAMLEALPEVTVLIAPGEPITASILSYIASNWFTIALTALSIGAGLLLTPSISAAANARPGSPNNALAGRSNQPAVPGGRIEDIQGTVRSYPRLMMVYTKFVNHQEVEVFYGRVGRGAYAIDTIDSAPQIKDGDSLVADIDGAQVAVYGPNTSPNSGSPEVEVGGSFTEPLYATRRLNEVNGQTLKAPNQDQVYADMVFTYVDADTGTIAQTGSPEFDFTDYFEVGDVILIGGGAEGGVDLAGTGYVIESVAANLITLDDPASINADWGAPLQGATSSNIEAISVVRRENASVIGPFVADLSDDGRLSVNVVALSGLYKTDSANQIAESVVIRVSLQPIDENGDADGSPETFDGTVTGSATTKDTRAVTIPCDPTFAQRCTVTVQRISETDHEFDGTVIDEVKLRDIFVLTPVTQDHFGDVTTVLARTPATQLALQAKERKLNMVVTRKRYIWDGDEFGAVLTATTSAADIIRAICVDPYIGNLTEAEVDMNGIGDAVQAVIDHFGTGEAGEFCFTFDDDQISFEETLRAIASAVFCEPYRTRDGKVSLRADLPTADSSLIFNHRTIIPGSMTPAASFGPRNNHDGVDLRYRDPADDTEAVYRTNEEAVNPLVITRVGVRNFAQAYWHAWREQNRLDYSAESVSFEALPFAITLPRLERVLVADVTRSDNLGFQGEIRGQASLTLTLSQPFEFEDGHTYTIFLQHFDGTSEGIGITTGADEYHVVLDGAPSQELAIDPDLAMRTTYIIGDDAEGPQAPHLVMAREPGSGTNVRLSCIRYRSEFYQNDSDAPNDLFFWSDGSPVLWSDGSPVSGSAS